MFEDIEDDLTDEDEELDEDGSNRTFLIVAGGLGGLALLSLVCFALYLVVLAPGRNNQRATQEAEAFRQQTQVALAAKQTEEVQAWTLTPTIAPSATVAPTKTPTPVVVQPTNTSVVAAADPRTATVAALLTQAAGATSVPTSTAFPTALPNTGFADDVGVPGMLAMAAVLVIVMFLARRLRTASS